MTVRQTPDQDDFAAEPRSLDLREYWLIVRRRWRLVAVIAVLGAVCGVEYSAHAGHTYTAQASVVVDAVTQGPQGGSTPVTTPVNMSTEQAIAQSPAAIQLAAAKLGVPVAKLDASVAKRLSVSVPASTLTTSNVLQVAWQADKPALAQQGADAFAAAYLAYRQHVLQGQVTVLQKNLQQQATTLKNEISSLSGQLSRTTAGTSANQVLTVELTQVSQQYNTIQTDLAAIPAYNASGGQLISALLPSKPSGLSRSVLAAAGLILGLLIGLVVAFARDLFDDRMRDSGQLEQRLGAVTLAVLPSSVSRAEVRPTRPGAKPGSPPVIAMAAAPDGAAAEAARTMRAAVIAVSSRRKLRVMLLVGADASVSSGQVAAELGVALAESDRRVLLVASDLRGSVLPRIFGVSGSAGLSELLISGGDPETVIQRPQEASAAPLPDEITERLTVLPSGQPTPFALSVLDSSRMRDLLGRQREHHDFVLLDAPPATVADVLSLAAHIDGVIVLVRERKTAAKDIDALRHRLEQVGVPIVGGVLISRRRLGRELRRIVRPKTTSSRPVIERAQPSPPVLADEPEAAAPWAATVMSTDPDDTIALPVPGDPLKRRQ
jgi:Mrp family chromosome partitioning ATPase/capsular polysaccharide biosynthesis protein